MAQLEGAVRAAQLELDRLADKRYADKARRLAAIALIEEVGKNAAAGTPPSGSAPSSDPRQKQQAMFFGPGAPPATSPQSTAPTLDEKAENDIARAFEMCAREIPPPDPTPAASTPAASTSAVPLTRPTLSRVLTAPGSEGQAEMAVGDAVPADEGEEVSAPADAPATEGAAAPETTFAKDSANGPTKQEGSAGKERERAEGDGSSGLN